MSTLASVFIGVPQSRYAALAVLLAMVAVALSVVFGKDPIPMSQKFWLVIMVFLVSLPSLAMSLFQLTCLVTGAGFKNQRWWCSGYAWILSALVIFYCALLIIAAIMSATNAGKEGFSAAPKKKLEEGFSTVPKKKLQEGFEEMMKKKEGFEEIKKEDFEEMMKKIDEKKSEEKKEGFFAKKKTA